MIARMTVWTLFVATCALLLGCGEQVRLDTLEDDGRPPIVVKGGTIVFEAGQTTSAQNKWETAGNDWDETTASSDEVVGFRAEVIRATGPRCQVGRGRGAIHIGYMTPGQGTAPSVERLVLTGNTNRVRLTRPQSVSLALEADDTVLAGRPEWGLLVFVAGQGDSCTVPRDARVEIYAQRSR